MHPAPVTAAAALALLLVAATSRLVAQGLASPGPLSAAHARLEGLAHCLDCHDAGRELSGRKCLACHVSLAAEIRADRGYHAVATKHGTALGCATCHSEHNGRPFQLVRWRDAGVATRDAFDHHQTGFDLAGAHAKVHCDDCHKASMIAVAAVRNDSSVAPARTYLGLGTRCADCHLDEHRGRASLTCTNCHTQTVWKPAPGFDHGRTTFPLTGLHATVACGRCHTVRVQVARGPGGSVDSSFLDFRATRTSSAAGCAGCHPSPHHEASMAGSCERCHVATGWFVLTSSVRRFDHTATGFALRGAHAAARCESCHLSSQASALPDSVALVRANFLRPLERRPERMAFARCDACHAPVHAGELPGGKDCAACHTETRFTPVVFTLAAHDSTRFPLTGAHRAIPCSACHALLPGAAPHSGQLRFRIADLACASCHRDPHGGQFAGRRVPGSGAVLAVEASARIACTPCHVTDAWRPARFDHDSTRYPLRGAHRTLACAKCHVAPARGRPVRYAGLPLTCNGAGCHVDPHAGQFANRARGSECTSCHTEAAWSALVFDHQRDTDYPLDGAHRRLACAACHKPTGSPPVVQYAPLPHRCEDCHTLAPKGGST